MSTTDEYRDVKAPHVLISLHNDGTATTHGFVVEWEMSDEGSDSESPFAGSR